MLKSSLLRIMRFVLRNKKELITLCCIATLSVLVAGLISGIGAWAYVIAVAFFILSAVGIGSFIALDMVLARWHFILREIQNVRSNNVSRAATLSAQSKPKSVDYDDEIAFVREALHSATASNPARAKPKKTLSPIYRASQLTNQQPPITVVVPLYNEERFVADTITSLQRQTFKKFKVIIVDDASTDQSAIVARKQIGNDKRFEFARHQKNSGLSAARNTGLRLADTQFITFLDSDDILLPHSLEERLQKFETLSDDAISGVFCGMAVGPETINAHYLPTNLSWCGAIKDFVTSAGECPFNAHAPLLRTKIVRKFGGFNEHLLHGGEDWDLWQRMMRHGYYFIPTESIGAVYRQKRMSMIRRMPIKHLEHGHQLFTKSNLEIDPSEIVSGTPFLFDQGVSHYQRKILESKRTLQFSAIAYMSAPKQSELKNIASTIPADYWPYIENSYDVKKTVSSGVRRFLAVDPSVTNAESDLLDKTCDTIISLMQQHSSKAMESAAKLPTTKRVDITFFPQTLFQAKKMISLLSGLHEKGFRSSIVQVETVTGDQGVRDFLVKENLPFVSYNEYVLKGHSSAIGVVMRPHTHLIKSLVAESCEKSIELTSDENNVSMPDQNTPVTPDTYAIASDFIEVAEKTLNENGSVVVASGDNKREQKDINQVGSLAPLLINKEEALDLFPDQEKIASLHNKFLGERCFIIGNGPSINETDLTKLKDSYTFAVNGIFYKQDEMGFQPTFYVVEDSSVMKENVEAIQNYEANYKFFPTLYRNLHPAADNTQFFQMNRGFYEPTSPSFCVPRFSYDASQRLYCGQSVTHINLQLAYYLGFSEVYLIGMDFSYVIPESAVVKGDLILSTEDDPNHFHGDYFGKGKTWKDPKLHRVLLNYELARDAYEADGRKIINATKGGKLEVFDRVFYDDLF